MNLNGPDDKISMIQLINQYAYIEEVQDFFALLINPISGVKGGLLQRLKKPLAAAKPEDISNILSKGPLTKTWEHLRLDSPNLDKKKRYLFDRLARKELNFYVFRKMEAVL